MDVIVIQQVEERRQVAALVVRDERHFGLDWKIEIYGSDGGKFEMV